MGNSYFDSIHTFSNVRKSLGCYVKIFVTSPLLKSVKFYLASERK